jgi:hypothetical protein
VTPLHHGDTDDDEADAEEEEEEEGKAPPLKRTKNNPTDTKKRKHTEDITRLAHFKRHKRLITHSSDEEDADNEERKNREPPNHSHKGVT